MGMMTKWRDWRVAIILVWGLAGPPASAQICDLAFLAPELPPYGFVDRGTNVGAALDIVREMAARQGCNVTVTPVPRIRAQMLTQHAPNTIIAPVARTPGREDQFTWLGTIARETVSIYALASSPAMDLAGLKSGATVAVLRNSAIERLAERLALPNVVAAPDNTALVRMLAAGRVDAIISARSLTVNAMRAEGMDPARFRLGEDVAEFDVAAAMSNGSDPAIVRRLRSSLHDMKTDGSLQHALLKYRIPPPPDKPPIATE
jgi:polar amino acid transport system substrate-binding protein